MTHDLAAASNRISAPDRFSGNEQSSSNPSHRPCRGQPHSFWDRARGGGPKSQVIHLSPPHRSSCRFPQAKAQLPDVPPRRSHSSRFPIESLKVLLFRQNADFRELPLKLDVFGVEFKV